MEYVVEIIGLAVLIALGVVILLRRRQRMFLKQKRLSSAFDRSRGAHAYGDSAQTKSQNIVIAGLISG